MDQSIIYSEYRQFLEEFATTLDPNDQLPVKFGSYMLVEADIPGEVIDWTVQYLLKKKCPQAMFTPIINNVMLEVKKTIAAMPENCGYNTETKLYEPLKLMQMVAGQVNQVCLRLMDNAELDNLLESYGNKPAPRYAICSVKNRRRGMEDRHICLDDLNSLYEIKENDHPSFYGVFDGHGGTDAAAFCASHLHQYLANHPQYITSPETALRDAFFKADEEFLKKLTKRNMQSGTTALCVLLRPVEQKMYIGWVGDSKGILVSDGNLMQIVRPHKPDNERERIEAAGGSVIYWCNDFRVNGILAVSRAIGDAQYKSVVIPDPDIVVVPMTGYEDFLVLGCDGLWDHVTDDDAAYMVYKQVRNNPDNIDIVPKRLVEFAIEQGSEDNISVIIVFLKDPHKIATSPWPLAAIPSLTAPTLRNSEIKMDTAWGEFNNSNGMFSNINQNTLHDFNTNGNEELRAAICEGQTTSEQLINKDITENKNVSDENLNNQEVIDERDFIAAEISKVTSDPPLNGKRQPSVFDAVEEVYVGPETDVDGGDESAMNEFIKEVEFEERKEIDEIVESDHQMASLMATIPISEIPFLDNIIEQTQGIMESVTEKDLKTVDNDIIYDINAIEDNRVVDVIQNEIEGAKNETDLSEKKEYSFEREDYGKEFESSRSTPQTEPLSSPMDEITNRIVDQMTDELNAVVQSQIQSDIIPLTEMESQALLVDESIIIPNEVSLPKHMLETSEDLEDQLIHSIKNESEAVINNETNLGTTAIESGDETEDEWNYIKGEHNKSGEIQIETDQSSFNREIIEGESTITEEPGELDKCVIDQVAQEILLGNEESDKHILEESHAIAQAIAEPQEACVDLLQVNEDEQGNDLELISIENNKNSHQQQLNTNQLSELAAESDLQELTEEDMAKQLNPNAVGFVPTSPSHSPTNPDIFIMNGDTGRKSFLPNLNDDVIAQSPRKAVPMDNIALPSENEFETEFSQRPSELKNETHRSESSCSQASYQEMNLKEAMHGDEKQEYAPEEEISVNIDISHTLDTLQTGGDVMNTSFYNINPNDLNAVQPLPDDIIDDESIVETNGESKQILNEGDIDDLLQVSSGLSPDAAEFNPYQVKPVLDIANNEPNELKDSTAALQSTLAAINEDRPLSPATIIAIPSLDKVEGNCKNNGETTTVAVTSPMAVAAATGVAVATINEISKQTQSNVSKREDKKTIDNAKKTTVQKHISSIGAKRPATTAATNVKSSNGKTLTSTITAARSHTTSTARPRTVPTASTSSIQKKSSGTLTKKPSVSTTTKSVPPINKPLKLQSSSSGTNMAARKIVGARSTVSVTAATKPGVNSSATRTIVSKVGSLPPKMTTTKILGTGAPTTAKVRPVLSATTLSSKQISPRNNLPLSPKSKTQSQTSTSITGAEKQIKESTATKITARTSTASHVKLGSPRGTVSSNLRKIEAAKPGESSPKSSDVIRQPRTPIIKAIPEIKLTKATPPSINRISNTGIKRTPLKKVTTTTTVTSKTPTSNGTVTSKIIKSTKTQETVNEIERKIEIIGTNNFGTTDSNNPDIIDQLNGDLNAINTPSIDNSIITEDIIKTDVIPSAIEDIVEVVDLISP